MNITKIENSELKEALTLIWDVFEKFESPDYVEEGIKEFKNFISYNSIIKEVDNGQLDFWGSFDNNKLIGVICTRNTNHICMFFVDKNYHKQGIGRSLFNIIKDNCKKDKNITTITVNSSPYATGFYHKMGFTDTKEEQTVNGIRFVPMIYKLSEK